MSEARALSNLIGNGVAGRVVGKWCNEVDVDRLQNIWRTRARKKVMSRKSSLPRKLA
jgi:Na+/H+-dicarboxylate symporter